MRDLPAAGAVWFLTARADTDEEAAAALAALHDRYRPLAVAATVPIRCAPNAYPPAAQARIAELQATLAHTGWDWQPPARPFNRGSAKAVRRAHRWRDVTGGIPRPALAGLAILIIAGNIAIYLLGLITVIRWIW